MGVGAEAPSLLSGLIFDSDGAHLSPAHAVKKGKRYRYVSTALITRSRAEHPKGRRIPAGDIEGLVLDRLRAHFASGSDHGTFPRDQRLPSIVTQTYCSDGTRKVRVSPQKGACKRGRGKGSNAMKRFGILMATAALGAALVANGPAAAFTGGGWHGGGWRGGGWRGAGWHGGWNRRYGWNNGWGWGGLGLGLGLSGLGYGYGYPYNYAYGYGYPYDYSYGYGYPYDYSYGYGFPYDYSYGYGAGLAVAATEPLMTGRSVAVGGNYCATPVKTCLLSQTSWVGNGCSCRVYGGHARGTVE
jgi:hypothetical protein